MTPLTDADYRQLTRRVFLDIAVDTLGNLMLGLGLYLVFSAQALSLPEWSRSPEVKAALIATGLLNLRYLPVRLRRLQQWQRERQQRRQP